MIINCFLRFNVVASVQTKVLFTTSLTPTQQTKGPIPTIVTSDSGGMSIGKKLWTKVLFILNKNCLFMILLGCQFIPSRNFTSSQCYRSYRCRFNYR